MSPQQRAYYTLIDGVNPHTEECIKVNDLSFTEVCLCEDLNQ